MSPKAGAKKSAPCLWYAADLCICRLLFNAVRVAAHIFDRKFATVDNDVYKYERC